MSSAAVVIGTLRVNPYLTNLRLVLFDDLSVSISCFNQLYTGGLFQCYMLDESIRHVRGVRSILSLLFYF